MNRSCCSAFVSKRGTPVKSGTEAQKARGRIGGLVALRPHDHQAIEDARRDLAAAKLADYIKRTVDAAPPLTEEQKDRLTALLRPIPTAGADDTAAGAP